MKRKEFISVIKFYIGKQIMITSVYAGRGTIMDPFIANIKMIIPYTVNTSIKIMKQRHYPFGVMEDVKKFMTRVSKNQRKFKRRKEIVEAKLYDLMLVDKIRGISIGRNSDC